MAATAASADIIYQLSSGIGQVNINGTITTDGKLGQLQQSDFLDWDLTVSVFGVGTDVFLGPEEAGGDNSILAMNTVAGSNLVAGSSRITFTNQYLGFFFDLTSTSTNAMFSLFSPAAFFPSNGAIDVTIPGAQNIYQDSFVPGGIGFGDYLKTVTPEPSTWGMMFAAILCFAGWRAATYKRRRLARILPPGANTPQAH